MLSGVWAGLCCHVKQYGMFYSPLGRMERRRCWILGCNGKDGWVGIGIGIER